MIWCTRFNIQKNKTLEFQVSRWPNAPIFDFEFDKTNAGERDHHGVELAVTLFKQEFRVHFYDCRHKEEFK